MAAEVVDIQTLDVQRKASQRDEMGLWTKGDTNPITGRGGGGRGTKKLPKLPPIGKSNESSSSSATTETTTTVTAATTVSQYKRPNRKRITVSFVKRSSDVNDNGVDEDQYNNAHAAAQDANALAHAQNAHVQNAHAHAPAQDALAHSQNASQGKMAAGYADPTQSQYLYEDHTVEQEHDADSDETPQRKNNEDYDEEDDENSDDDEEEDVDEGDWTPRPLGGIPGIHWGLPRGVFPRDLPVLLPGILHHPAERRP